MVWDFCTGSLLLMKLTSIEGFLRAWKSCQNLVCLLLKSEGNSLMLDFLGHVAQKSTVPEGSRSGFRSTFPGPVCWGGKFSVSDLLLCSSESQQLCSGNTAASATQAFGNYTAIEDVRQMFSCLDRRNQNYTNILRFLTLGDKKLSPFNITHRFTHLFWLGDLNYRVEQPPTVRDAAGTARSVAIGVLFFQSRAT